MEDHGSQLAYWDSVGATKTFTHPLDLGHLTNLRPTARILDYGCGYGRTMAELSKHGFTDLTGVDLSPALIARGRREYPDLRFDVLDKPPALPYADATFDLVILFAVLTCIPDDAAQRALVDELTRVLTPGGLLYVSDLLLQDDDRNLTRYAAHAKQTSAPYGVFATEDGAICRHHDPTHLRNLLAELEPVAEGPINVTTMNGHRSNAIQLLGRKR